MPRRSPPPNRLWAEDVLLPEEVRAIKTSAAAMGVPPDRWTHVNSLAHWWGAVATVRLSERLHQETGLTGDRALAVAATKLGLNYDTIRSSLYRIFKQSYGR